MKETCTNKILTHTTDRQYLLRTQTYLYTETDIAQTRTYMYAWSYTNDQQTINKQH